MKRREDIGQIVIRRRAYQERRELQRNVVLPLVPRAIQHRRADDGCTIS